MSDPQTLFVDGCTLHFRVYGRADAPAVVLSHGATLDQESWAPQVPALSEHYRVVTWDLRGHGLSQPLEGKFTMERGAKDLLAILDHLGIEKAALVGLSMGSYVSQRLLLDHPRRVAALASFDATSLTGFTMGRAMRWMLSTSDLILALYPENMLVETIARNAAERPETRDYIRRVVGRLKKRTIIDIWSAVQTGLMDAPDYREPVPLMIAIGEHDKVGLTARGARQWAGQRPDARFEVIPGAGHCANQDNPEHATRVLLEFLQAHWDEIEEVR